MGGVGKVEYDEAKLTGEIQVKDVGKGAFGALDEVRAGEIVEYDVRNLYKTEGWIQAVARHSLFENITLGVISLNALYFFFDTDYNMLEPDETEHVAFAICNQIFCFYFFFELLIRFLAFKRKLDCFSDNWFRFDFVLVALMVADTWILKLIMLIIGTEGSENPLAKLSILRLLRLARLTRLVRLMSAFPELLTLLKGMIASIRSVGSTLLLLIIFLYVFAIAFTQVAFDGRTWESTPAICSIQPNKTAGTLYVDCAEPEFVLDDMFGGMPKSMLSLFMAGTLLDDITAVVDIFKEAPQGGLLMFFFFLYVLVSSFTVLNMLIGVLCEVVSATAVGENEKLMMMQVKEVMERVFDRIDEDGNRNISKEEFEKMNKDPAINKAFELLGVETKDVMIMADAVFEPDLEPDDPGFMNPLGQTDIAVMETADGEKSKQLSFDDFLELVCHMRPGTPASVLDIAEMRKSLRNSSRKLEKDVQLLTSRLKAIKGGAPVPAAGGPSASDVQKQINAAVDKIMPQYQKAMQEHVEKALAKLSQD